MKLKTLIKTAIGLALMLIICAIIFSVTGVTLFAYLTLGAMVVMVALLALFNKCPYCGKHFGTLNANVIVTKHCPHCGRWLDI